MYSGTHGSNSWHMITSTLKEPFLPSFRTTYVRGRFESYCTVLGRCWACFRVEDLFFLAEMVLMSPREFAQSFSMVFYSSCLA
jgi:hypothetical protein